MRQISRDSLAQMRRVRPQSEGVQEEIGETGFEPATTGTPYRCATKLRHSPTATIIPDKDRPRNREARYQQQDQLCSPQEKPPFRLRNGGSKGGRLLKRQENDSCFRAGIHIR